MGQGNNKFACIIEKAQELNSDLEQISKQLDASRNQMFDLAEIPHMRDLNEPNFQRDVYFIENALNYMNSCYSQTSFIQDTTFNLKKLSMEILNLKNLLIKYNNKYETLLELYVQYNGADDLIQDLLQDIDWKRLALVQYFIVDKLDYDDCNKSNKCEEKSEGSVSTQIIYRP